MSNALEKPAESALAVVLPPEEVPAPLVALALSNGGYWTRVRRSIVWQMREYVKKDFAYSLLAAAIAGAVTVLDGSATITTLVWAVIGFLAVFSAQLVRHAVSTPALMDQAIKQALVSSEQRLKEIARDRLVFEIDGEKTTIRLEQHGSDEAGLVIRIWLAILLRFENLDPAHPTSMKRLDLKLHRGGAEIFSWLSIARYSLEGIPIAKKDIEGMMMQEGRLTPWYLVEAALTVADDQIAHATDLRDGRDYITLTMYAGGHQPPFTARLIPHWEGALREGGTKQVVVIGAPYIQKDYRRFD